MVKVITDLSKLNKGIYAFQVRSYECGPDGRVTLPTLCNYLQEAAGDLSFVARRGDIDLNGHVNNVHYIEWLVETLPDEVGMVRDFEIVFKSETLAGETVRAASVEVEPNVWAAHVGAVDGRDHVVARFTL